MLKNIVILTLALFCSVNVMADDYNKNSMLKAKFFGPDIIGVQDVTISYNSIIIETSKLKLIAGSIKRSSKTDDVVTAADWKDNFISEFDFYMEHSCSICSNYYQVN